RPGPAGRPRPRPGRRAGRAVRRRADRRTRLAHRRAGDGAAGRLGPQTGRHGRAGHPRGPGRRVLRPGDHGSRRPGHHARGGVVIRLGVRLALTGGRAAIARLALVGGAVAVGVALLLGVFAGIDAVQAQNLRYAWLNSAVTTAATGPAAHDPAGWALREDYFDGKRIARVDVAVTGPDSPV